MIFDIAPLKLKQDSKYKKRSLKRENKNDHVIFKRATIDDLDKNNYYPDYVLPGKLTPVLIKKHLKLHEYMIILIFDLEQLSANKIPFV